MKPACPGLVEIRRPRSAPAQFESTILSNLALSARVCLT